MDGTNAQPGYHINLAAYKFAQDRVKPLQAAGRRRCKRGGDEGRREPGVSRPWALLRAVYYPLPCVTEFCGRLRIAAAHSLAVEKS